MTIIEQLKRFPEISPNIFDLRELKSMSELNEVIESITREHNLLLHGTPIEINELHPKQANDDSRPSGNQNAVYATNFPERAIFHAIINKTYLSEKFNDFSTGYSSYDRDVLEFEFTKNVKDLIDKGDREVFCDGYIHALRDETFKKSEGDDSEYQSNEAVKPLFSLLISRDLGEDVKKRSRVYNPEEFKKKI